MQFGRVVAICAAAVLLCLASSALLADETLQVFDGTTDAVVLGSWGSGEIKLDEEQTFADHQTLAITTNGYHEGGRLDLKKPVDFTAFAADPLQTQLIILAKAKEPEQLWPYGGYGLPGGGPMMPGMPQPYGGYGLPGAGMPMPPGAGMPMPPGAGMPMPPGAGMPMPPGAGMPMPPGAGMPPGWGAPGAAGMPGMPGAGMMQVSQPAKPIDRIRVVLVTDKGQLSSGGLLLDTNLALEGDWLRLSAVLSDFARPEDLQGATLQRVVITGNHEGTIYVGEVEIVQEDTPLVAQIEGAQVRHVRAGQTVQFTAKPQHEGVNANYQWDFDDLDGLSTNAYGESVSYQFPEAGYYVVTLRVADSNGQLQPRMDTVKVKVE